MAQLRQDIDRFDERETTIVVIGPENSKRFASYFGRHNLPFVGLPDPKHKVLKKYGQEVNLFKLGRMPAQLIIDKNGIVRFVHYGSSMSDIPPNEELLSLLDRIQQEERVLVA